MIFPPPPPPLPTVGEPPWFWRRVGARIVDSAVVGVPVLVLYLAVVVGTRDEFSQCGFDQPGNGFCPSGARLSPYVGALVAYVVTRLIYVAVLEGLTGTTIGRLTTGIRVVDAETRKPIGPQRAIGRYLLSLPLLIPAAVISMSSAVGRDRTWHDRAVGAVVNRAENASL